MTSTPGKTRNRKTQQDLANRSENKTDTIMALVSFHIRSSFNEENVIGLSTTHWLEAFEGLTLLFVISSWTEAAVVTLVSGVNALPFWHQSGDWWVWHMCVLWWQSCLLLPSEEWRIWWRSLRYLFFFSLWFPSCSLWRWKEMNIPPVVPSGGTLRLKTRFGTISFTLLLLILLWCSLCEVPKLLVFHQRVLY